MSPKYFVVLLVLFGLSCFQNTYAAFPVKRDNNTAYKETTVTDRASENPAANEKTVSDFTHKGSIVHKHNFFYTIKHGLKKIYGGDDDEYDPAIFAPHVAGWGALLDLILLGLFHIPLTLFYILLGLFGVAGIVLGIWGIRNHTPHLFKAVSGIVIGILVLLIAIGLPKNF